MAEEIACNDRLAVAVLAAGEGKRMKSGMPKVLHRICGRPIISCLLETLDSLGAGSVTVVVGNGSDEIREMAGGSYRFVKQAEQKGTADATRVALVGLDPSFDEILVLPGDTPLITLQTLERLITARRKTDAAASMLMAEMRDPFGYGRVVRSLGGEVVKVVEETDATEQEKKISQINAGMYLFRRQQLTEALAAVTDSNAQSEFYLTDVVRILARKGLSVIAVEAASEEILGINNRVQLAEAAAVMHDRTNRRLMESGVTILDPRNTYIEQCVQVGHETQVLPMTFLSGETVIGSGCTIGPCTSINDTTVGNDASVEFSVVDGCEIGEGANVGPFSRLRPGCVLGPGSKSGSFVEMKKTKVGKGSKVPHLSYMGDAVIGEDANVGAGSITCNYDGETKSTTSIGDRAFIGSDTMLVAPVRVGDDAVTGAGSVISRDVPDGSLAIERTEQKIVEDYKSKKKGRKADGR